jgi:hypothetical protein
MTQSDCIAKYGPIVAGEWAQEEAHCILIDLPSYVCSSVINTATGKLWAHIYLNQDMADPLLNALSKAKTRGCLSEIKTFDGCSNVRMIRGSTDLWSAHSWGMAVDFNAKQMPLGSLSKWSAELVQCFVEEGFVNGAEFSRLDPQHFSLAGF